MVLLFSFSFISFVAQAKAQFRSTCLTESINLQKKIIEFEKKLFLLNPLSTLLDQQLKLAYLQLAAVPASPALAAKIWIEIARINAQQLKLDRTQRGIIFVANSVIAADLILTKSKIISKTHDLSQIWAVYIETIFSVDSFRTEMAVRPLRSGMAPNYELKPSYKALQTVAFNWHFSYFTKVESQTLVASQNEFLLSCGIQPERRESRWELEIQKDRSF